MRSNLCHYDKVAIDSDNGYRILGSTYPYGKGFLLRDDFSKNKKVVDFLKKRRYIDKDMTTEIIRIAEKRYGLILIYDRSEGKPLYGLEYKEDKRMDVSNFDTQDVLSWIKSTGRLKRARQCYTSDEMAELVKECLDDIDIDINKVDLFELVEYFQGE